MNELGMTFSQTVFVLLVMGFTFVIGYSVGWRSGREEGFRKGWHQARSITKWAQK